MARTDIKWAGRIESSTGGGIPGFALGAPDGQSAVFGEGRSATYADWGRASYEGLADLLGTVVAGDAVTPEMLVSADVIAFEMNGNAPAHSGGWESCDWEFHDSQGSIVVHWDESTEGGVPLGTPVPRDSHVVANGTITGAAYGSFFGLPPALVTTGQPTLTPEQVRVSFLLFRVRGEIDVTGPAFRLTLTGVPTTPTAPNATPDPDAIGVLLHADLQPERPVKPIRSPTRQVLDLCRAAKIEEAVLPAIAAVWDRRAAGHPSRGDFEREIYAVFDRLSDEHRAALTHGFDRFKAFRALGTDTCLFTDRLAGTVADRPLERGPFTAEFVREGAAFAAQSFFHGSAGEMGPGLARPWRRPAALDEETAGPVVIAPWPWITAIRRTGDDNEYGNLESFIPPPGVHYQPLKYQFDQKCDLKPALDGTLVQDCKRVQAPHAGGFGGVCAGGPNYTFGQDCLRFPSQAAGGSVSMRGFNFITPSAKVHLKSREQPNRPPDVLDCIVWGDRATKLNHPDGTVIADMNVQDYVDVPLPREDPQHIGAPFPAGLYDIWISTTDTSGPSPVERASNRLVLQIEPRADIRFALTSNRGRCTEETSGPGSDEIWWDAFVGLVVPDISGATPVKLLERVQFPRDAWAEMDDGKRTEYACKLFDRPIGLDGALCVGIVGLEVDSEAAARELLRGFWDAFAEAMLAIGLVAIGAVGAGADLVTQAIKAGAAIKVSSTVLLASVAIAAAVILISVSFWAAWAPAEIVAVDVFALDALTSARHTDSRTALPEASERSWRVEGEWMVTREFPKPKIGTPGEGTMIWVQENEYISPGPGSRYVLEFRLEQR